MSEAMAEAVEAVRRAAACEPFLNDLAALYMRVDAAQAGADALCLGGGACCRFDLAGHCLYASSGEIALLIQSSPADPSRCRRRRCPYQAGPRCTARQRRPLGCRIFFCNRRVGSAVGDLYETHHRRIRLLHQTHCLPYAYTDAVDLLMQLLSNG